MAPDALTDAQAPANPASPNWDTERARLLNIDCQCVSVDPDQLLAELSARLGNDVAANLLEAHRTVFAAFPVFVASRHVEAMHAVTAAIEAAVATDGYRREVAQRTPSELWREDLESPPLLSFDFHLGESGPKLIEINTNPGGVLLGLSVARAQRACCGEVAGVMQGAPGFGAVEAALIESFRDARRRLAEATGQDPQLRSVAIVDSHPKEQFLYPEMQLYRHLLRTAGIETAILGLEELESVASVPDLIYNRHTDFYLQEAAAGTLRRWWTSGAVAVTPNPMAYALYADKRNLTLLADDSRLAAWEVAPTHRESLRANIPATFSIGPSDAEALWKRRRELFFKPTNGYGSRGAYDGVKLTRKTFETLLAASYVAQERIEPSERTLIVDGEPQRLKVDLRYIRHAGQPIIVLARLYRGQTTNLRTAGGGLATVFAV